MPTYLDYNASMPTKREVIEKMLPHFREQHGNPSSTHYFGQRAKAAVEEARAHVASLIGADPAEIVFVSGGTEADNMAIMGTLAERPGALAISAIEHPAVFNLANKLEKNGRKVIRLGVDSNGVVNLAELESVLSQRQTALVSVMTANNETGVIQPVERIGTLCRQAEVLFHTDAAQATGKIQFRVDQQDIDLATLAAHKMGGPIGIGALFIRSGISLERLLEGGSQEINRRPGTESVPLIVGFGEACRLAAKSLDIETERLSAMREKMENAIRNQIPDITINGADVKRLPNTSNIAIAGISAETLVIRLDLEGFAVSAGSACHSGRTQTSRTLSAMGLSDEQALSSIRISLGPDTKESEILAFVDTLVKVVAEIRSN